MQHYDQSNHNITKNRNYRPPVRWDPRLNIHNLINGGTGTYYILEVIKTHTLFNNIWIFQD